LVALYIAANGRATNAAGVYKIRQALIDNALPQTQWRSYPNTGDPDTNHEGMAIASENWVPAAWITQPAKTRWALAATLRSCRVTPTRCKPPPTSPHERLDQPPHHQRTGSVVTTAFTNTSGAPARFYRLQRQPTQ